VHYKIVAAFVLYSASLLDRLRHSWCDAR